MSIKPVTKIYGHSVINWFGARIVWVDEEKYREQWIC